MKLGLLKDIDWSHVGALLAQSDDEKQTDFFKAFVKECKSWGTNYQVEQQLAAVNLRLSGEEALKKAEEQSIRYFCPIINGTCRPECYCFIPAST